MQELIEKLQTKVKSYKRQAETAVSLVLTPVFKVPLTTRLCRVCLLPPGGAGELQWRTLQENSTWAGRCRGESRHRRDHCQQAARTNTTTDHEIHPGETTTQMSDISHMDMSDVIWFWVTFSYISLLANSSQVSCFSQFIYYGCNCFHFNNTYTYIIIYVYIYLFKHCFTDCRVTISHHWRRRWRFFHPSLTFDYFVF